MKAASISIRIADFLKDYPPFSFLKKNDLAELASRGRVKFHEAGEIVFTIGQPRDRFLYVIQQGRVRIIEELDQGENLIDLRGPGDIIGLQGIISDDPYHRSARTEAETILYGLPRDGFVQLAQSSPEARRYLSAYFSLNPAYADESELQRASHPHATLLKGGLQQVDPVQITARLSLVTVAPDAPVREVAQLLTSKMINCVIIVDPQGRPLGKLTDADLRDRILDGRLIPDSMACDVMFTDIVTGMFSDDTGKLIIRMTRAGKHFVVITEDGTINTQAVGLVSERNLFLQYGRFPTVLGEAISSASNISMLRMLRERLEALILEFLDDRTAMRWLMDLVGVLNRKMVQRVTELAAERMVKEGWESPDLGFSWLLMGSGGRDELLIRSAVYHALIYEDAASPEAAEAAGRYFKEFAARVGEGIRQCGFLESQQGVLAFNDPWCRPMSGMKAWFSDLIREPDVNDVYLARDAFDFRPLVHLCPLSTELRNHIHAEIAANPGFIPNMANDSLLNQPPRTIFQHYVVDEKGMQTDALQIKVHALLPLVDVARVFAMEGLSITPTSTWRRLEVMADRIEASAPEEAQLLREASQASILAAYVRTKSGLIGGSDGAVIRPTELDAETRNLLKTAFRSILSLLEFTAARYDLELRA